MKKINKTDIFSEITDTKLSSLKRVRQKVTDGYIVREPMLAVKGSEGMNGSGEQIVAERKHDGIRARILDGKLIDRRGNDITKKFPEFKGIENIKLPLDGEVVAQTGVFEDVSGRVHVKDKFKRNLMMKKNPARFVVFDIPVRNVPYKNRRKALNQFFDESGFICTWMQLVKVHSMSSHSDWDSLWSVVKAKNWEGLMLKSMHHYYVAGRSDAWIKVKNFVESVEEFDEYESHNRGIKLMQSETGRSVNINGAQAAPIAKKIDDEGSVMAEIQYMEQQNSDRWRIPSFKRLAGEQE